MGLDFGTAGGTLSFASGALSRTFTVPIFNDTTAEGSAALVLSLSNPNGGALLGPQNTSVLTIADNDTAGTVQFAVAAYSVSEVGSALTVTVTRSGGTASSVTVDYATSDGSASAGSDYTAASGTISFGALEVSKTFTVTILDDGWSEAASETVHLALGNLGGNAQLGATGTAVLFIVDDE